MPRDKNYNKDVELNPAQSIIDKDRLRLVADEESVGAHFDGESKRERKVGHDRAVVVDIFKRIVGLDKGTYYLRVSLRCPINPQIITRGYIDLDKYSSEAEFLKHVAILGGAAAEAQCTQRGAQWDCEWVAKQAWQAGKELLHEYQKQ